MNQFCDADGNTIKDPRPLRSLEHMWGLPCLTRDARQLMAIGHVLLEP